MKNLTIISGIFTLLFSEVCAQKTYVRCYLSTEISMRLPTRRELTDPIAMKPPLVPKINIPKWMEFFAVIIHIRDCERFRTLEFIKYKELKGLSLNKQLSEKIVLNNRGLLKLGMEDEDFLFEIISSFRKEIYQCQKLKGWISAKHIMKTYHLSLKDLEKLVTN